MIRLAFITDATRIVGYSRMTGERLNWLDLLPESVPDVMREVLYSENIAVSRNGFNMCRSLIFAFYDTFILTKDTTFRPTSGCRVCNDYNQLIRRFHDSSDELLVSGGEPLLNLFLPWATSLDVVESDVKIPGDVVFNGWDDNSFAVTSAKARPGVQIVHYRRKRRLLAWQDANSTSG